ncbi:hypothetical protein ASD54_14735 [Rhizobium sp. Root149]|uniref:DUF1178 family protein n=1 Tax=Rhizobium rhizoryzae TaxID=451876 RepID=A0A7W6PS24_9HYPH|nr:MULTISPECIES: DUF1178 family protein [Rhizobium]KQZ49212.1 hypothetical protein ASD54_14735 [Rhizobium sp. Root149]MBB4144554.1 hypothetical protein [Rhizobium rhizoryzae]
MIRYTLVCDNAHSFEGWFSSSSDFDQQVESGFLTCPVCNSASVYKALMAPSVSTARKQEQRQQVAMDIARQEAIAKLREAVQTIRSSAEDVGERFPEEARKIHYGETEQRGIIGQASLNEVRELIDEGIEVAPLPVLPEDAN